MSAPDPYTRAFGAREPGVSYEAYEPSPGPRGPQGPRAKRPPLGLYHEVFVIYRPITTCPFCKRKLYKAEEEEHEESAGEYEPREILPDTGEEYLCPHVRSKQYHALLQREVRGEIQITGTVTSTLMNGVTQVVLTWTVYQK